MSLLDRWVESWDPQERSYPTPGALAFALDQGTRQSKALDVVDEALVRLYDTPGRRNLAIYMPPQEGKSERVSRRFPTWCLADNPGLRIAVVSAEQDLAVRWGRDVKRDIMTDAEAFPRVRLRSDTRAAGRWQTTAGGGMYCVGLRGILTGKPVDILIIDDPYKDRADAESPVQRERVWDFWESVGRPRLSGQGKVVLVQTRWHHDDLGGRLEDREGDRWEVVSIPAIATSPDDALGREVGEEFPTIRDREVGYFRDLSTLMSAYAFSALYQQTPTVAEGNLFKRADWRHWEWCPEGIHVKDETRALDRKWKLEDLNRFITVDLAASTKTSADYTVAAAWGISIDGDILLLDRRRERVGEEDHFDLVRALRDEWLGPFDVTYVEKNMIGSTLVYQAGQAGIPFAPLDADADKTTRALPAANLVRQHKVWLPRGASWRDEWVDEHAEFPKTAHDDQVDVMAYAARVAVAHWLPPAPEKVAAPRSTEFDAMSFNY